MDWLYDLVVSGIELNVQLQTIRTPFLDTLFTIITMLGSEPFYLATLPFFYWSVHKGFGRKLAYLFIFNTYLNTFLKTLFALPRPFQVDERVIAVVGAERYGLPSGHAQISTGYLGYIAWYWRQRFFWGLPVAVLLVGAIAFSRLYLGVHFPADVVTGLGLGLLITWLWARYETQVWQKLQRFGDRFVLMLGIIGPVVLLFTMAGDESGYPAEDSATITGTWLGTNVGLYYETRRVGFSSVGTWGQRLLRYGVGLLVVIVVWGGLRAVFGAFDAGHGLAIALRFIRYTITGLVLTWFVPALFLRLGLATPEESAIDSGQPE